jgi:chaperone modulatory protein CbpM
MRTERRALRRVALEAGVTVEELEGWVERRWVRPALSQGGFAFDDADRARIRMILEFNRDLAIDEEAMPVVLDLLDRLHAARALLRNVLQGVAELPEAPRTRILRHIKGEAEK